MRDFCLIEINIMQYRYRIATVFLLGFFIDCVNIFMSVMALPTISLQMQLSANTTTWVSNIYILGLTLVMPLSTWLANILGARKLLTLSMLIFAVASLFCGLSDDLPSLLFWRLLQGIGGGLMIPLGQALVFQAFPTSERSQVSTMIMAIALIAPAFSPSLGGMILDYASWSWVFWFNVPLALLAAFAAHSWVAEKPLHVKPSQPDWLGLVLISMGLLCLLVAFTQYGNALNNVLAHLSLAASVVLFLGYWRYAKNNAHALVDFSLLRNRRLSVSMLVYYAVPGIFTGVNFLAIFYLQTVLQFSATATGQLMLLYAGGAFAAMLFAGRYYNRFGAKILLFVGLLLHNLGIASLFFVNDAKQMGVLIAAYLLMGLGGGLSANVAQTTALLDFKDEPLLKGSILWNMNRQIAFCVGVAVLTLIYSLWHLLVASDQAYQYSFVSAAVLGSCTLLFLHKLTPHQKG